MGCPFSKGKPPRAGCPIIDLTPLHSAAPPTSRVRGKHPELDLEWFSESHFLFPHLTHCQTIPPPRPTHQSISVSCTFRFYGSHHPELNGPLVIIVILYVGRALSSLCGESFSIQIIFSARPTFVSYCKHWLLP